MSIAYKIVLVDTIYVNREPKQIRKSGFCDGEYELVYEQYMVTTPHIGKIFCFRLLEEAKEFLIAHNSSRSHREIWECEIEEWEVFAPLEVAYYTSGIFGFWNNYDRIRRDKAPKGTVLANSVKLIKCVFERGR